MTAISAPMPAITAAAPAAATTATAIGATQNAASPGSAPSSNAPSSNAPSSNAPPSNSQPSNTPPLSAPRLTANFQQAVAALLPKQFKPATTNPVQATPAPASQPHPASDQTSAAGNITPAPRSPALNAQTAATIQANAKAKTAVDPTQPNAAQRANKSDRTKHPGGQTETATANIVPPTPASPSQPPPAPPVTIQPVTIQAGTTEAGIIQVATIKPGSAKPALTQPSAAQPQTSASTLPPGNKPITQSHEAAQTPATLPAASASPSAPPADTAPKHTHSQPATPSSFTQTAATPTTQSPAKLAVPFQQPSVAHTTPTSQNPATTLAPTAAFATTLATPFPANVTDPTPALHPATAQTITQTSGALVGLTSLPGTGADAGTRLTIAMAPPAIGTVTVQIDSAANGAATIAISASHPATLAALQSDQSAIQTMLTLAGVPTDHRSIAFHLDPPPADSTTTTLTQSGGQPGMGSFGAGGFGPGNDRQPNGPPTGSGPQPANPTGTAALPGARRTIAATAPATTQSLRRFGVNMMV